MSAQHEGGAPTGADDVLRLELANAKRAARWVGLIMPLAITALGTLITALWIPRMPDPMATHWNADFEPNGFGPPWTNAAMALGFGLLMTAISLLQEWQRPRPGAVAWSTMNRVLPAIVLGSVVLIQVLAIGTAGAQLDLEDARDAGSIAAALAFAFGFAVAAVAIGLLAQPRLRIGGSEVRAADPLRLAPGERAVWLGETRLRRPLYLFVSALALLSLAMLLAVIVEGDPAWWLAPVPFLVLALMLWTCGTQYRVRVDARGIEARGVLGWPVFRVPVSDIASVRATEINPIAEFGGWGLRWWPGRFGIVMRAGPGIVVTRVSGRSWAVTVDRSEQGAALLAAMVEQANRKAEQ